MYDADNEAMPEPPEPSMPMYEETLAKATQASIGVPGQLHRPTITELLLHKKSQLEFELQRVNEALEIASKNKGAMDLMDAVAKTRVHG